MPDLLPFVLSDRSFAKSFSWVSSFNMQSVHNLGLLSHTTSFPGLPPTGFWTGRIEPWERRCYLSRFRALHVLDSKNGIDENRQLT